MFYVSFLQPLKGKPLTYKVPPPPPIIVNNGNGSYFINLINDIQQKKRSKQFKLFIKWEGYKTQTQETYNQIKADAPSLVKEFYKDYPSRPTLAGQI